MESWKQELYLDELYHHGIKGQKWGVRRFQNPDGTLTELGRKHYAQSELARGLDILGRYKREGIHRYKRVADDKANPEAVRTLKEGSMLNRQLRTTEYRITDTQHALRRNLHTQGKYEKKYDKQLSKGASKEDLKKTQSKIDAHKAEAKRLEASIEAGKKASQRLLQQALDKDYAVYVKEVNRFTRARTTSSLGSSHPGGIGLLAPRWGSLPIREDFFRKPVYLLPTERYTKYQVKRKPKKDDEKRH